MKLHHQTRFPHFQSTTLHCSDFWTNQVCFFYYLGVFKKDYFFISFKKKVNTFNIGMYDWLDRLLTMQCDHACKASLGLIKIMIMSAMNKKMYRLTSSNNIVLFCYLDSSLCISGCRLPNCITTPVPKVVWSVLAYPVIMVTHTKAVRRVGWVITEVTGNTHKVTWICFIFLFLSSSSIFLFYCRLLILVNEHCDV